MRRSWTPGESRSLGAVGGHSTPVRMAVVRWRVGGEVAEADAGKGTCPQSLCAAGWIVQCTAVMKALWFFIPLNVDLTHSQLSLLLGVYLRGLKMDSKPGTPGLINSSPKTVAASLWTGEWIKHWGCGLAGRDLV